jgi:hypothetical protein
VWEVTRHDFVILDPNNPTDNERANKQCNTMALNTIYNGIDAKVFEQVNSKKCQALYAKGQAIQLQDEG